MNWQPFGRHVQCFSVVIVLGLFAYGAAQAQPATVQSGANVQKVPRVNGAKISPLVVGSEQDFPPFALGMTDDTAGGFTVDLWKAIAEEQGLSYTIRVRPFRQILKEFKEGKIDVLINLAISDERRQFADLTVPHVVVHGAVFVRKGESNIRTEDDLAGKSIIVLNADLGHDYAMSKGWGKQLVLVDTAADGFRLLASGKHDAILLSKLAGMQTLKALELTNIEAKARAGFSQRFAFAVHSGQSELLAKLNEGMALTKSNGTYDALYERWFGVYEVKEIGLFDRLKYTIPIALVFLAIGGYFLYRRKVERNQSETKLRTLYAALDQSSASVVVTDLAAGIQYVNTSFSEVTGYSAAEAMGQNPRILKSMRTPKETYSELWGKLTSGHAWKGELLNKRKNGELYWEEAHIAPVKNMTGDVTHYVAVKTDISKRKEAEKALQEASQYARRLIESSLDPLVTISADGKIRDVNAATEKVTGVDRRNLIGSDFASYFTDAEKARKGYEKVFAQDFLTDYPLAIRHASGKVTDVLYNATVYRDGSGNVRGVFAAARDITERKRQENLIKEHNVLLVRQKAELEATLSRIRHLEGMLSICMHCKKIRTGNNDWHQLERYISEHSDAVFSHGLCPECYEKEINKLD